MTETPENPSREWSQEARTFFGNEFTKIVDEGTSIFEEHPIEEIESNPSLAIELERRARPLEERAIQIGSSVFLNYLFKYQRLRRDLGTAFDRFDDLISSAYPEWNGGHSNAVLFLNSVVGHGIRSIILARIAKWRHRNNKRGRFEHVFYQFFGTTYDRMRANSIFRGMPRVFQGYGSYYEYLQLEDFLQKNGIQQQEDENDISTEERTRINNTIAEIITDNRRFGIPLSIHDNENLGARKINIQFEEFDPQSPVHAIGLAQAILYNENEGLMIKNEPNLMGVSQERPREGQAPYNAGEFSTLAGGVPLDIDRFGGEIFSPQIHSTGLKFYFGEGTYELLRTHLLLQLAELTCDQRSLYRALRNIIQLPDNTPPEPGESGSMPRGPSHEKLLPSRYFPRSILQNEKEQNDNQRTVRLHNVEYHKRLLPIGYRPSERALQLARDNDLTLETVIGENGNVRYETFVQKHHRGVAHPTLTPQNEVLAVQAVSRNNLIEALNRTPRRG